MTALLLAAALLWLVIWFWRWATREEDPEPPHLIQRSDAYWDDLP